MRMRWLIWLCGIVLLLASWLTKDLVDAAVAFSIGIFVGFFIDWAGIKVFRFWDYPRQPFLGWRYFLIALPDWGVIGMIINLIWNWIENPWLAFGAVAVALFMTHEFPNLKTKSWKYNAPSWLVVVGWVIAILSFRIIFVMIFWASSGCPFALLEQYFLINRR